MKLVFLLFVAVCGVWSEEWSCIDEAANFAAQGPMPGGWFESTVGDSTKVVLNEALSGAENRVNPDNIAAVKYDGSASVTKVYTQVVAGYKYCIEFAGNTPSDDTPVDLDCSVNSEHEFCTSKRRCEAEIYHRPWEGAAELLTLNCN